MKPVLFAFAVVVLSCHGDSTRADDRPAPAKGFRYVVKYNTYHRSVCYQTISVGCTVHPLSEIAVRHEVRLENYSVAGRDYRAKRVPLSRPVSLGVQEIRPSG